jgi:hypothetical protein
VPLIIRFDPTTPPPQGTGFSWLAYESDSCAGFPRQRTRVIIELRCKTDKCPLESQPNVRCCGYDKSS